LVIADPKTEERIVRLSETNLGDLCADAYRAMSGADIAFVNGGGVRSTIKAGDITYGDIIKVHPFGNNMCMVEATGEEIYEALEMSANALPSEYG
ncbi:MAG: 5'-nucleotidase C-terminal domain-containing protein, partial [Lachnospiraceae bacterium]|nr:5'-nucleotidase C-terminal domain-containing protein [Lachnospiraceae bacterium]